MENAKVLNLFFETGDVLIRLVPNLSEADVLVKGDGTIKLVQKKEAVIASDNLSDESKNFLAGHDETKTAIIDLDTMISKILIKLGIPANIKGYRYTREALKLVINDPEIMNSVTKVLYPKVAEIFDTTPSRVERAIRHSIEVSVERGDKKLLDKYFTYSSDVSKKKPTNSEFIAGLADHIRLSNK